MYSWLTYDLETLVLFESLNNTNILKAMYEEHEEFAQFWSF